MSGKGKLKVKEVNRFGVNLIQVQFCLMPKQFMSINGMAGGINRIFAVL